jgi:hypothetical protein
MKGDFKISPCPSLRKRGRRAPRRWAKSTAGAEKAGKKEINHDPEQRERSREDYVVNVP